MHRYCLFQKYLSMFWPNTLIHSPSYHIWYLTRKRALGWKNYIFKQIKNQGRANRICEFWVLHHIMFTNTIIPALLSVREYFSNRLIKFTLLWQDRAQFWDNSLRKGWIINLFFSWRRKHVNVFLKY